MLYRYTAWCQVASDLFTSSRHSGYSGAVIVYYSVGEALEGFPLETVRLKFRAITLPRLLS